MNIDNLKYTKAKIIYRPKFIISRSSIVNLIDNNLLSLIDYSIDYSNNKIKNINVCPSTTLKNISEYLFKLDKSEIQYIFADYSINSSKDILNVLDDIPEFLEMSFAQYLYNYIKHSI